MPGIRRTLALRRSTAAISHPGAALFVSRSRLSVSELLAPALGGRRRGPGASRVRGCEPRPRAPHPRSVNQTPLEDALVSGDYQNKLLDYGNKLAIRNIFPQVT